VVVVVVVAVVVLAAANVAAVTAVFEVFNNTVSNPNYMGSNERAITNYELEGTWKEAVLSECKVYSEIIL
jgi:hypothetical protein